MIIDVLNDLSLTRFDVNAERCRKAFRNEVWERGTNLTFQMRMGPARKRLCPPYIKV
jgi:hypothetical protein